jgi:probable rRNA maturation factor
MKLDIVFQSTKKGIDINDLEKITQIVEDKFNLESPSVSLVFNTKAQIQKLNKAWRQKDKPTDVLSFSALEGGEFPAADGRFLGEIFICLDIAESQAKEYKNTFQQEVNKLFIHGMVHLLGYDHEDDDEYLEMQQIEDEIAEAFYHKSF